MYVTQKAEGGGQPNNAAGCDNDHERTPVTSAPPAAGTKPVFDLAWPL